uniref:Serine protease n=1 Tax=Prevotella sp. GTC17253 TaxID=3236793 RepID=A0AB33INX5_9BACT
MRKTLYLLLLIALFFSSCNTQKTAEELFEQDKSGVVMVINRFYYEIEMSNGEKLYFTGLDENGNLANVTAQLADIKGKEGMLTGTGFFIDKQGTLLTNRHVVGTDIDENAVKQGLSRAIEQLAYYYQQYAGELQTQYDQLEASKSYNLETDIWGNETTTSEQQNAEIETQQAELSNKYNQLQGLIAYLTGGGVDINHVKIKVAVQLGVAYNGDNVSNPYGLINKNPCRLVNISTSYHDRMRVKGMDKYEINAACQNPDDADLAIIRLSNNMTPESAYVFHFIGDQPQDTSILDFLKKEKSSKDLKIDQQLYMIGYNAGPTLAGNDQRIQAQLTSGKITQTTDGVRLLYSIPTVQGSSGSPVINEDGDVLAVNFAKLAVSDNFNFGIPIQKIRKFMGYRKTL